MGVLGGVEFLGNGKGQERRRGNVMNEWGRVAW